MIANGYRTPQFEIYDLTGSKVDTIEMPLTNSKGLVESYEIKKLEHELDDFTVLSSIKGYRISFTLHYDEYISGDTLLLIQNIINYAYCGYKLVLIPRSDILFSWRKFEVYVSMNSFDLGIGKGGLAANYNRLPVLVFTTKYLQNSLQWNVQGVQTLGGSTLNSPMEGGRQ